MLHFFRFFFLIDTITCGMPENFSSFIKIHKFFIRTVLMYRNIICHRRQLFNSFQICPIFGFVKNSSYQMILIVFKYLLIFYKKTYHLKLFFTMRCDKKTTTTYYYVFFFVFLVFP